jgi:adenylate cyclase
MRSAQFTRALFIASLATLFAVIVQIIYQPSLTPLDARVYDIGLTSRAVRQPDNIEILGIDDAFMQGRHAYLAPRDRLAKLLDALAEARPSVILLDVWLDSRINDHDDIALRNALLKAKNRGIPIFLTDVDLQASETNGSTPHTSQTGVTAHGSVLPFFRQAVTKTGDAAFASGGDSAIRTMPTNTRLDFLPWLVAETVKRKAKDAPSEAWFENIATRLASERIPIDYRGGPGSIRITPALQFVQQPAFATLLQDKIVFIGATSPRLYDIFETPYSYSKVGNARSLYGVELLAHATATLLDGAPRKAQNTPAAFAQTFLLTLMVALATALLAWRGALPGILFALLAIGSSLALGFYTARDAPLWLGAHFWPPTLISLAAFLAMVQSTALRQWQQARELKVVSDAFGAYVGAEVLEQLGGKMPELGGELRHIAVLFCDIRGYTALAERMQNDPAKLMNELNQHFTPLVQALKDHGAYADNYVGDLVMALFGAPVAATSPRHDVYNAVAAARAFVRLIDERNCARRASGLEPIEVGIGLHCGEAVVGNLGTLGKQSKIHYTAIGDTVNIASRIESKTRQYDVPLLVSEEVVQICSRLGETEKETADSTARYPLIPATDWTFVDETTVKGRQAPIRLYKPANLI